MRKLLLLFSVALITINVWGQTTTNIFPVDGNVGIGTINPNNKLQIIHSTENISGSHGISVGRYTSTTVNSTNYNKAIYAGISNYRISPGITDAGYRIAVDASSFAYDEDFKGTLSKAIGVWARSGIHVAGSGARINNAFGVYVDMLNNDVDGIIDNAYGVYINNSATVGTITNRFDLYAASSNAINYIAGNVGIGTTSPSEKLEVIGNIRLSNNNFFTRSNNQMLNDAPLYGFGLTNIVSGGSYLYQFSDYYGITFATSGSNVLTIAKSKNVGIGTTDPTYKLTVVGTIGCEEVKVEIIDGADKVFEEDYNLKKLDELEEFVKTNKHLPEIATEKEMQANGVDMGEFQIQLLQKIEELTLYTIQQQELINALQKRVEQLENR